MYELVSVSYVLQGEVQIPNFNRLTNFQACRQKITNFRIFRS